MKENKKQTEVFKESEADSWFLRNKDIFDKKTDDLIVNTIIDLNIPFNDVLEVGCSNGYRLNILNNKKSGSFNGIDPSKKAIEDGKNNFKNINLEIGTAEKLPYKDNQFDLLIFGFCLYVCDREDLFEIASEANRVLKKGGHIIILDFDSPYPYANNYHHLDGLKSYKMNYSEMFLWNPKYTLKHKHILSHDFTEDISKVDDRISLSIILKQNNEYINNPYK